MTCNLSHLQKHRNLIDKYCIHCQTLPIFQFDMCKMRSYQLSYQN